MQYLLKNSDENNTIAASEIVDHLSEEIGIYAERRSIYSDIDEINKAMLIDFQNMTLKQAEEEIAKYGDDARYIIYNSNKKGYYVRERRYELDEIRLVVESIYASKFLSETETEKLVNLICHLVSDNQAFKIRHDVLLTDRVKTKNKFTFKNVSTINSAMSKEQNHLPEKISFKYMKTSISDVKNQVERRQGKKYSVSPYAILLNDGNYYLLGYDDKAKKILTYRVDRMRSVELTGIPREGAKEFAEIDLRTYTQRVFSMFGGKQEEVQIHFTNRLLDAVIDRFGTNNVRYYKVDNDHFSISAQVEISEQFFGWICGFADKAKIIAPRRVVDQFSSYIDKIKGLYQ